MPTRNLETRRRNDRKHREKYRILLNLCRDVMRDKFPEIYAALRKDAGLLERGERPKQRKKR